MLISLRTRRHEMSKQYLEVLGTDSFDKLVKWLTNFGIQTELVNKCEISGYSRTIQFVLDEQTYQIVWFNNESKLKIGTNNRSPFVNFKYIYLDTTYPLVGGNKSLGFSFAKKECVGMFDQPFSYQDFRIPL